MAVRVKVQRGDGSKQGPDIVDSLIPDEIVARERGRVYIDENYTNRIRMDATVPFQSWPPINSLVRIDDMHAGAKQGLCRDISLSMQRSEDSIQTDLRFSLEVEE